MHDDRHRESGCRDGRGETRYLPHPSTSHGHRYHNQPLRLTAGEQSEQITKNVEKNKVRILPAKGNYDVINFKDTATIDETYVIVGSHLDSITIDKIKNGDYVDFGKLISRDWVLMEEDQRLEMINKNGKPFYVPVSEITAITSFAKWEQAFRVFSNIYSKANPHRSSELIEYNHIIHTISLSYIWDNVYLYDKDFRMHLARNPEHSWSIILQQAWSLRLKDRIHAALHESNGSNAGASPSNAKDSPYNYCKRYNKGHCSFGLSCRYNHRCSYCFKMGHSILTCRKLQADIERNR